MSTPRIETRDPPPPTEAGDPHRRRLAPLLRQAWYNLNQAFRRRIAGHGITPDQFTILRWLAEHPEGTTQRDLAVLMSSDPNTITSILNRMQDAGLVERSEHERDRRALRIRLLAKGRTLHAKLQPVAAALQEEILGDLPPAQREEFLAQLEALSVACREAAKRSRG